MIQAMVCLLVVLGPASAVLASENSRRKSIDLPGDSAMAELKPGPGIDTVRANCIACHSTDYIVRQPPSDAKRWEAEVKKMMTVFGAPISDADAKAIVGYLASAYGPPAKNRPSSGPKKSSR